MILSNKRCDRRARSICFIFTGLPVVLMLAGCGSGSGGGAGSASAVGITQQNSPQAAGASYQAANSAESSSTAGSSTFISVVTTDTTKKPSLAQFAQRQIVRLDGLDYFSGGAVASSVSASETVPCDTPVSSGAAGSTSIKVNDADGSGTLTSGDSFDATFNNCYIAADGQTINGGFSMSVVNIIGDPQIANTAWTVKANFTLSSLSIADSTGTEAVNGGFTFSANTSNGIDESVTLSGASLSVQQSGEPTISLDNFSLSGSDNKNTAAYTFYGSGRVTDSSLNGYVDFQISASTPLRGIGSLDPDSGTMTITGAGNSSVKVTAIDATTAQLQVDADGDGTFEYTTTKSWTGLAP